MMEKMCNDDPDMYIIIAFMGILHVRIEERWFPRFSRSNGDFPSLFDFQVILFHPRNVLLALFLPSTPRLKSVYLLYLSMDDDVPRRVGDGRHVLGGSAGQSSYLESGALLWRFPLEVCDPSRLCSRGGHLVELLGGQVRWWSVGSRLPSLVRVQGCLMKRRR
jgi:hypothetical protein